MAVNRRALAVITAITLCSGCGGRKVPMPVPAQTPSISTEWLEAESLALAAPPEAETSIAALAAYLAPRELPEEEKARAIFRWVTAHVDYDLEGYKSGAFESSGADETLKRRSAVCEGYSSLFEALASRAGLECATIHGFAKGAGYHVGAAFTGAHNHAWNAVLLGGRWRLLDCTWGAGALDERGAYVHAFEPFYFDTPPDEFIYTHWPAEERWQLAKHPISREAFERLPWLKPCFFKCGLSLGPEFSAAKMTAPDARLFFGVPQGVDLRGYLIRGETKVFAEPLPLERGERGAVVEAVLPSPGAYAVRLYAGCSGQKLMLEWAADIDLCWNGEEGAAPAPPATS